MGAQFSSLQRSAADTLLPTTMPHPSSDSSSSSAALKRLIGPTIPLHDKYWTSALPEIIHACNHLLSSGRDTFMEDMFTQSITHHSASLNLQHLLITLSSHLRSLSHEYTQQQQQQQQQQQHTEVAAGYTGTYKIEEWRGVLHYCTQLIHYIIKHTQLSQIQQCFNTHIDSVNSTTANILTAALSHTIIHLPLTADTYHFHGQLCETLQVLLSTQHYHSRTLDIQQHPFVAALMGEREQTEHSHTLIITFLQHYCTQINKDRQKHTQHADGIHTPTATGARGGTSLAHASRTSSALLSSSSILDTSMSIPGPSLLRVLGSSLSSFLSLPFKIFRYFFPPQHKTDVLAELSLTTALLLIHQQHEVDNNSLTPASSYSVHNPHRNAIKQLTDAEAIDAPAAPTRAITPISFDELYTAILYSLPSSSSILLVYTLLNLSPSFLSYIYAKTDVELFFLPLLHELYTQIHIRQGVQSPKFYQEHLLLHKDTYMFLMILLLLSHDASFITTTHRQLILPSIAFHTDYTLHDISLGSFMMLLLLRLLQLLIQTHPCTETDEQLCQTVLCILLNLSHDCYHLHATVVRRMMNVLEILSKKYKRIRRKQQLLVQRHHNATNNNYTNSSTSSNNNSENEVGREMSLVCSRLSSYLSLLCACLSPQMLADNITLMYWLMAEQRHVIMVSTEERANIKIQCDYLLTLCAYFTHTIQLQLKQHTHGKSGGTSGAATVSASSTITAAASSVPVVLPSVSISAGEIDGVLSLMSAAAHAYRYQPNHADHQLSSSTSSSSSSSSSAAASSLPPILSNTIPVIIPQFRYEEQPQSEYFFIPFIWPRCLNAVVSIGTGEVIEEEGEQDGNSLTAADEQEAGDQAV